MRGVALIFVMVIGALLGAWLWPYTITTWAEYFGKSVNVLWWHGVLLGFCPIIGHATIPAAIVTWVLMLILV